MIAWAHFDKVKWVKKRNKLRIDWRYLINFYFQTKGKAGTMRTLISYRDCSRLWWSRSKFQSGHSELWCNWWRCDKFSFLNRRQFCSIELFRSHRDNETIFQDRVYSLVFPVTFHYSLWYLRNETSVRTLGAVGTFVPIFFVFSVTIFPEAKGIKMDVTADIGFGVVPSCIWGKVSKRLEVQVTILELCKTFVG